MIRENKREQILKAASHLFINHGYQAVTMEQIAFDAPVSKPTLYNHFKDKEDLFKSFVDDRCQKVFAKLREGLEKDADLEEGLEAFGRQFLDLLLDKSSLKFHKVMIAESESFPQMARLFYECGPQKMVLLLEEFLAKSALKKQKYKFSDPSLSASLFMGMLKGHIHVKCLLGLQKQSLDQEQKSKIVRKVTDIFLNGHNASA